MPQRSEKDNMIRFLEELISPMLEIQLKQDMDIERVYRIGNTAQMRASVPHTAAPRPILVRFWNYQVKEKVTQAAWKQRNVYKRQDIYFNLDYTAEIQRQRVRVIKKLKELNVKAIFLDGGIKSFTYLKDAAAILREMGISMEEEDETEIKKDLQSSRWNVVTSQKT